MTDQQTLHAVQEDPTVIHPNPAANSSGSGISTKQLLIVTSLTALTTAAVTWLVTYGLEKTVGRRRDEEERREVDAGGRARANAAPSSHGGWPGTHEPSEDERFGTYDDRLRRVERTLDERARVLEQRMEDMEGHMWRNSGRGVRDRLMGDDDS